ncbi:MAG: hypothetical protein AAF416_18725 [Pseudomonadota bacterium]
MTPLWILPALVAANCIGTAALKKGADTGLIDWILVGCGCYLAGAGLYVAILRAGDVGTWAVITSLVQIVTMVLLGRFVFGEAMSWVQVAGVALALGALVLMTMPVAAAK